MVYQPVVQYPAITQPVPLNPTDQVSPVFAESWVQPFSEPVLPIEYRYQLESYFGQTLLESLHVPPVFAESWVQPWLQLVLPVEYRYQLESFFGQTLEDSLYTAVEAVKRRRVGMSISGMMRM